ncbi:MAG: FKBP-type peptidyl-prolyl cis-trans isomerase [Treponema sp.]|jgi:FKBP-type peptidyl-prolyl cis-trans isomerase|nr:FKBP-type peptidyl-prolyl cis-trans isomerase [Treponema sp.]
MKNIKKYAALALCLALAPSIYGQTAADAKADRSYAYGLAIGSDLKSIGLEFDYDAVSQGIRDAIEGREARFTMDEALALVQQSYMAALERQTEENRLKEIQFLEENGKRRGVVTTASGLQYEVVRAAGKEKPNPQSVVRVNYEGTFTDGTVFDSSFERGEPSDIPLDMVIPGWSEGLCLMGVGDVYTLYIPSRLGYGEGGAQTIAPYTPLVFKVELLEILAGEEG